MQLFDIAGLTLAVDAPQLLAVGGKWSRFLVHQGEERKPQLLYRVAYADTLAQPFTLPSYRDAQVRYFPCEGGSLRIYSNFCTATDSLSVLEHTEGETIVQDMTILKQRHPWGTQVDHLTEVFDLSHYLPRFGRLLLHCAYILYEGEAILFTAPSGTGKSTQAELWRSHLGATVVNGDRAVIGMENGCMMAYGVPISGSSDDCENISAPVRAVVSLCQAKENTIRRLSGAQALKHLMRGAYILPEHQTDFPRQVELAAQMLPNAAVFHLACLPNVEAAQLLRSQL